MSTPIGMHLSTTTDQEQIRAQKGDRNGYSHVWNSRNAFVFHIILLSTDPKTTSRLMQAVDADRCLVIRSPGNPLAFLKFILTTKKSACWACMNVTFSYHILLISRRSRHVSSRRYLLVEFSLPRRLRGSAISVLPMFHEA